MEEGPRTPRVPPGTCTIIPWTVLIQTDSKAADPHGPGAPGRGYRKAWSRAQGTRAPVLGTSEGRAASRAPRSPGMGVDTPGAPCCALHSPAAVQPAPAMCTGARGQPRVGRTSPLPHGLGSLWLNARKKTGWGQGGSEALEVGGARGRGLPGVADRWVREGWVVGQAWYPGPSSPAWAAGGPAGQVFQDPPGKLLPARPYPGRRPHCGRVSLESTCLVSTVPGRQGRGRAAAHQPESRQLRRKSSSSITAPRFPRSRPSQLCAYQLTMCG